jgi:hypothetical protein
VADAVSPRVVEVARDRGAGGRDLGGGGSEGGEGQG